LAIEGHGFSLLIDLFNVVIFQLAMLVLAEGKGWFVVLVLFFLLAIVWLFFSSLENHEV
jgi:ABC-type bacteriocin/lantibiotic exporter with double-glycine peptidase domain